jgi:SAM-dependent methyltransferase
VGGVTFQIIQSGRPAPATAEEGVDFLLLKERPLVERYLELVDQIRPGNVFELGIFAGGSTAFLYELAQPRHLVAIDCRPPDTDALERHIARRGADEIRLHCDVDQRDRGRLARIADAEFGTEPLDLVVDDCSHLYQPTLASFNELFPRLRPAGAYVIEDWPWAHHRAMGRGSVGAMWPDEVPLTRLVFELTLALPAIPGLVSELTVDPWCVIVRRGETQLDPDGFELTDRIDRRGRELLAAANPGAAGTASASSGPTRGPG